MPVELLNVTKYYSERKAVDDVSLLIGDDDFFVILGPSGSGKTTLLRIIAGLVEPDAGVIKINGKEMNGVPPFERNVAMVFQNYALYPHMSVYDNIALNMKIRKMKKEEIDKRVKEVASKLHIEDLLTRKPAQLSGGQAQRVALARAMVRNPSVYLLDEPLSNLDAKLRTEMRAEIKSFLGSVGVPVIYVTHDQSEAMTLGTRVAVMNAGKVIQVGRPLELYEKPQNIFVAGFVGNPPMNILPLSAVNGLAAPLGHQRNEVAIGVRPMDLNIDGKGDVMISARITLMEILGDEVIIHAAMDSLSLVIKKELKTAAGLRVGDVIAIGLEENKVHWFRLSDGSRIEVNGN